jgi:hypothetical protein
MECMYVCMYVCMMLEQNNSNNNINNKAHFMYSCFFVIYLWGYRDNFKGGVI